MRRAFSKTSFSFSPPPVKNHLSFNFTEKNLSAKSLNLFEIHSPSKENETFTNDQLVNNPLFPNTKIMALNVVEPENDNNADLISKIKDFLKDFEMHFGDNELSEKFDEIRNNGSKEWVLALIALLAALLAVNLMKDEKEEKDDLINPITFEEKYEAVYFLIKGILESIIRDSSKEVLMTQNSCENRDWLSTQISEKTIVYYVNHTLNTHGIGLSRHIATLFAAQSHFKEDLAAYISYEAQIINAFNEENKNLAIEINALEKIIVDLSPEDEQFESKKMELKKLRLAYATNDIGANWMHKIYEKLQEMIILLSAEQIHPANLEDPESMKKIFKLYKKTLAQGVQQTKNYSPEFFPIPKENLPLSENNEKNHNRCIIS